MTFFTDRMADKIIMVVNPLILFNLWTDNRPSSPLPHFYLAPCAFFFYNKQQKQPPPPLPSISTQLNLSRQISRSRCCNDVSLTKELIKKYLCWRWELFPFSLSLFMVSITHECTDIKFSLVYFSGNEKCFPSPWHCS
jgi:hypothetical protein